MESEVIGLLIPVHTAITSDVTSGLSFAPGVNCLTSDSRIHTMSKRNESEKI